VHRDRDREREREREREKKERGREREREKERGNAVLPNWYILYFVKFNILMLTFMILNLTIKH
jgi:hypothetical protein